MTTPENAPACTHLILVHRRERLGGDNGSSIACVRCGAYVWTSDAMYADNPELANERVAAVFDPSWQIRVLSEEQ